MKTKQIKMAEYGSAGVLQISEQTTPSPGPNEVLIKVAAIGVNYSDILRRKNTYFMPTPLPYVLGAEVVGEIVEKGANITPPYEKGTRVLAILPSGGGYSAYVIAQAQYCIPLPPNVDSKAATALFVQGSTAHLILNDVAGEISGKTVLVHAGAGGVGSLLIQLAKLAGAKVIATASSDKKCQKAQSYGADITINYSHANWADQLIEANGGEKVDIVLEMVGGDIYTQSFKCLKTFGKMVVYGAASGQKGFIHSEHFVDESHQILPFNLAHYIQFKMPVWQNSLQEMVGLLAAEKVAIDSSSSYALEDASLAHQDIEARKTTGKVVLIP